MWNKPPADNSLRLFGGFVAWMKINSPTRNSEVFLPATNAGADLNLDTIIIPDLFPAEHYRETGTEVVYCVMPRSMWNNLISPIQDR